MIIRKETEWHITAKELPAPRAIAYLGVLDKDSDELELTTGFYNRDTNKFVNWANERCTWPVEQVKCWAAEIAMPVLEEVDEAAS